MAATHTHTAAFQARGDFPAEQATLGDQGELLDPQQPPAPQTPNGRASLARWAQGGRGLGAEGGVASPFKSCPRGSRSRRGPGARVRPVQPARLSLPSFLPSFLACLAMAQPPPPPPPPPCRSVLITGANRGIGFGLVQGLLAASPPPEFIFATCRCPEKAQELHQLCKQHSNLKVLQLDVVSESSIKEAVKEVEDIVGPQGLNCLINNAGINVSASLEEVTAEAMLTVFETNTVAQLMVTKAFLPLLRKAAQRGTGMGYHRATIVNMSSDSASMQLAEANEAFLKVYPYRVAKTALNMVTRCLATDLKADGILCISLHPGWIQTDMGGKMAPLEVQDIIAEILSVLARLSEKENGSFLSWQGETLPW